MALVVVALGLAALSSAVSGTARSSVILRDKMQAQWIALNRLAEVRLNLTKFGNNTDTGEVDFANRKWHYDTKYFDTNITTMKRVVVRVYAGDAKTKGNPLSETVGFTSSALATPPGTSNNLDWRTGSIGQAPVNGTPGTNIGTTGANGVPTVTGGQANTPIGNTPVPTGNPNPTP